MLFPWIKREGIPVGGKAEGGVNLLSVVLTRVHTNSTDIPKKTSVFPLKHQHGLPREVVEAPSLEIAQTQQHLALGNLLWVALLKQGGWSKSPWRSLQSQEFREGPNCSILPAHPPLQLTLRVPILMPKKIKNSFSTLKKKKNLDLLLCEAKKRFMA